MFEWDFDPVLIQIGFLQIRYYGVLFAAAFLVGLYMLRRFMVEKGYNPLVADSLLTYLVFGIVIGARIVHVLFYNTDYYFSHPLEMLKIWRGGVASHGAVLGAFVATYIFSKRHKFDPWDNLDSVSVQFLLCAAFIRLGNFFNSEIIGRVTDVPWAVKFVKVDQEWRHPSQFYEIFNHVAGYLLVVFLYRKFFDKMKTGVALSMVIIWYFTTRFIVEFFKEYQTMETGLTMGHRLSIPFVLAGLLMLWWRLRSGSDIPAPAPAKSSPPKTKSKKR